MNVHSNMTSAGSGSGALTPSQLNDRLARAGAAFDAIRKPFSPQDAGVSAFDRVRLAAKYRAAGVPCSGAMLVAPFGTGKTQLITKLCEHAAKTAEPGIIPVLAVQTSVLGTTDSVPTAILHALRIAKPEVGNEKVRWSRAVREMRQARVELVIFDEFNRAHRRPTMSAPIVNSIRQHIMDEGVAAVGFVGSEDASLVLGKCPEVIERLDDEIDLAPLDWISDEDKEILTDFLTEIEAEVLRLELIKASAGLREAPIAKALCEATNGRIRSIMKVIRHAMLRSMERGGDTIEIEDLYEGVDLMCVRKGFVAINPFAGGQHGE